MGDKEYRTLTMQLDSNEFTEAIGAFVARKMAALIMARMAEDADEDPEPMLDTVRCMNTLIDTFCIAAGPDVVATKEEARREAEVAAATHQAELLKVNGGLN